MSLRNKFAEVASQLSKKPQNTGNEVPLDEDASRAHACAKVVDDILPIVVSASDFLAFCTNQTEVLAYCLSYCTFIVFCRTFLDNCVPRVIRVLKHL